MSVSWGTNGRVKAILAADSRVFVAGDFSRVIDRAGSHPSGNVAVFDRNTGLFLSGFSTSADGLVTSLALSGNSLYLGGEFTRVNGPAAGHLAAVEAGTGNRIDGFGANANGNVDALLVGPGGLYASGNFKTVKSQGSAYPRANVARLSLSDGTPDGWKPDPNGRVRTLALSSDGSAVFLGGSFSSVHGSTDHNKVGKVLTDIAGNLPMGFKAGNTSPAGRQPVLSIAVGASDQLVLAAGGSGGACTSMNSNGGTLWTRGTNGDAQAAQIANGLAWCGGHFNTVGGQNRPKLAAFTLGGTLDQFTVDLNSPLGVWSLEQSGSTLFVGGDFTKAGQANVDHLISITP